MSRVHHSRRRRHARLEHAQLGALGPRPLRRLPVKDQLAVVARAAEDLAVVVKVDAPHGRPVTVELGDLAHDTRLHPRARVPLADTWRALEALVDAPGVRAGPLRSIGVSNFDAQLLCDLLAYARVPPAVLQVEHHPYLAQPQLVAAARETGVAVTAYSTFGPQSFLELGNPRAAAVPPLMDVPLVKAIAARHGRTPAQVLLRWCTQRGIVVIPKSMRAERVRENLDCCGFDLEAAELEAISSLDRGLRFNDPGVTHGGSVRIFT
ncbi:hypothetical protein BN1723_001788, partial [Verticillium longisporum]